LRDNLRTCHVVVIKTVDMVYITKKSVIFWSVSTALLKILRTFPFHLLVFLIFIDINLLTEVEKTKLSQNNYCSPFGVQP